MSNQQTLGSISPSYLENTLPIFDNYSKNVAVISDFEKNIDSFERSFRKYTTKLETTGKSFQNEQVSQK